MGCILSYEVKTGLESDRLSANLLPWQTIYNPSMIFYIDEFWGYILYYEITDIYLIIQV
jgi:hypothetical protein